MARAGTLGWGRILLMTGIALVATVLPLPDWLGYLRPDFVALSVLWLSLLSPRPVGLFHAFAAGLALDAFQGILLGQHALAMIVVAYIALRLRLQLRAFPLAQQMAAVLALLWLHEFILFWVDGVSGHAVTGWLRWLPVITGAACWPLVCTAWDRAVARR